MILTVPKDFINAFIRESGCATGGDTGETLIQNVFNARKEQLQEMYTAYLRSRKSDKNLDPQKRMRSYLNFISVYLLADND